MSRRRSATSRERDALVGSAAGALEPADARSSGGHPEANLPAPLQAMLDELSRSARRELQRALALSLFPTPTPKARREEELTTLTELLERHGVWPPMPSSTSARTTRSRSSTQGVSRELGDTDVAPGRFNRKPPVSPHPALSPRERWPTIPREFYDRRRGSQAPSSETLMRRHRASWVLVCRIACGLALSEDSQPLATSDPWLNAFRGRRGARGRPAYTREDCLSAIQLCAEAFNCSLAERGWLSVDRYRAWSAGQRRRARQLGLDAPRLPSDAIIYRLWGTWPTAVKAARRELRKAAARRGTSDG
jgi:hypothetical protein